MNKWKVKHMRLKIKLLALSAFFVALLAACVAYTVYDPPEGVAVLAYHKIGYDNDRYSVPTVEFDAQLAYLKQQGYTTISLLEFAKAKKGKFTLPDKPLVITFDDGYEDNYYTALPILEKYGMKGTVFMVVNDIGKKGYLTLAQLKEMERRNFEIGSHTANHLPLSTLTPEKKKEEIEISKLLLEWKGLKTVFFLAYPNGDYDAESRALLKESEYLGALTGESGLNTSATDPYILHRINVPKPNLGLAEFKLRLLKAEIFAKLGLFAH